MTEFSNPVSGSEDGPELYVFATLAMLGDREPAAVLAHTPQAFREMILGVEASVLARPECPGKWSVIGVIAHLADSELVWSNRLRMVLAQDQPDLAGFDQDLWAVRLGYDDREVHEELQLFEGVRRANLSLLERASDADMQRLGIHRERGEETVEHMVRLYAGHDLVHLAQARRILGSMAPIVQ